mmetsp:Transcript_92856/g.248428  ORF Transcript_92856/g.248428 Transcript_92856/m.248428 type:complete len:229 (-) Transcript_92856:434-1120(-)
MTRLRHAARRTPRSARRMSAWRAPSRSGTPTVWTRGTMRRRHAATPCRPAGSTPARKDTRGRPEWKIPCYRAMMWTGHAARRTPRSARRTSAWRAPSRSGTPMGWTRGTMRRRHAATPCRPARITPAQRDTRGRPGWRIPCSRGMTRPGRAARPCGPAGITPARRDTRGRLEWQTPCCRVMTRPGHAARRCRPAWITPARQDTRGRPGWRIPCCRGMTRMGHAARQVH